MASARQGDRSKASGQRKLNTEELGLRQSVEDARSTIKDSSTRFLLGQHDSAFPECKAPANRCPSVIRAPGSRIFDRDETNEVVIGVERRHDEESIDNDTSFSKRFEGASKRRVAETQRRNESFQERSSAPPMAPAGAATYMSPHSMLACSPRLRAVTKRTIQGKTVITKTTVRKEEETIIKGPLGEMDCKRNVDEHGTADEQTETNEEEVTEQYFDT